MRGINRVTLIGTVSKLRGAEGQAGRFVVTTTERYTTAAGEERQNESTMRVVCDQLPAKIEDGRTVLVTGNLITNRYTLSADKGGSEVPVVEVGSDVVALVSPATPHHNTIVVAGTAGNDPEMRYLNSGAAITNLRIATGSKPQNKQDEDTSVWMNASFWRKIGEIVNDQVRKGDRISIQGRATLRQYTTSAGGAGYSLDITVTEMVLPKPAVPVATAPQAAPQKASKGGPAPALATADDDFLDI